MNASLFGLFALFSVAPFLLFGQCGLSVDAGADQISCSGGPPLRLNGAVFGANVSGFRWTPATGLDDPTSLTPLVTISGQMTYTLEAEVALGAINLVKNGGFESGDSDFTSPYNPGSGGPSGLLSLPGEYTVTDRPETVNDNFAACTAREGSQLMAVNGSIDRGTNFWCQTVTITPNTTYRFSAWLTALYDDPDLAEVALLINGARVGGSTRVSPTVCEWTEMTTSWRSTSETSVELCLQNQNVELVGNDFGVDDIFFGSVCVQRDEVTVGSFEVEANAVRNVTLNCEGTTVLNGLASSRGPEFSYLWETFDGNIVSGATTLRPEVDAPGSYLLNVFYDDGVTACPTPARTTVIAVENQDKPVALAELSNLLTCATPTAVMSATGSSTGAQISYRWETGEGNIIEGADEFQATVDQPGFYNLIVRNNLSGCEEMFEVDVTVNEDRPRPRIENADELTCAGALQLDARRTRPNRDITARWRTTDGNIVAGGDGLQPLVDQPGTYQLIVIDDDNGCADSTSITITENRPDLTGIFIAPPPPLGCNSNAIRLRVEDTLGATNLTYQWSTTDGNIVADAGTATPQVDRAGVYRLEITDDGSGCSYQDSVVVATTVSLPNIALQTPLPFTCARAQITLDATGSSSGTNFTYAWSATDGGTIVAGADSLLPVVAGSGNYQLAITNAENGCSRDTTFFIASESTAPRADAGVGFELACGVSSATLNGAASSQGDQYRYRWVTANGVLVGRVDTLQPEISSAGVYDLIVTDTNNGCSDTASVVVQADAAAPPIVIAPADTINCRTDRVVLNATGSADTPGLVRSWSTPDGNIVAGDEGLTPTVDAPGTYVLSIRSGSSGCVSTESVTVTALTAPPVIDAGAPTTITCANPTVRLAATVPGATTRLDWQTTQGGLLSGQATVSPEVGRAGRYYLIAEDPISRCVAVDSVEVTTNQAPPVLDPGPALRTLTCRDTLFELRAGASAPDLRFNWSTTDGQLPGVDQSRVAVTTAGTYRLTVTDTLNGCSADTAVTILRDDDLPQVVIAPPATLNCERTELLLDGSATDQGDGFMLRWRTGDGRLVDNVTTTLATADRPGTYELLVINSATGCRDSARVMVGIDTVAPRARIAPPPLLTCTNDTLTLDGSASEGTAGFSWTWGTDDGSFAGPVTGLTPRVDAAGDYFVTVRNRDNGCRDSDTVRVVADRSFPPLRLGPSDPVLDCTTTRIRLGEDAGAEVGVVYRWRTGVGGSIDLGDTPTIDVDEPGTYLLAVQDTASGCTITGEVLVTEDRRVPAPIITPVAALNCRATERELSTAPPPPGVTYEYRWSTADGSIRGTTDAGQTLIDAPGTYQLLVTNPGNGCQDSVTTVVGIDTVAPRATIAPPAMLTCQVASLSLDAGASTAENEPLYRWSTADGNLVSGGSTLMPTVDAPGVYQLIIVDGANNCSDTVSVNVLRNDSLPRLTFSPPEVLTCLTTATSLGVVAEAAGGAPMISWATADGNIVGGATTLSPTVDQPGSYRLTVTNPTTDCRSSVEIVVTQNTVAPTISLPATADLGCEDEPVALAATASGDGPLSFAWSTPDGTLVEGASTARPLVRGAGSYRLVVTDQGNGCTATGELLAEQALLTGFTATPRLPDCQSALGAVTFAGVAGGTPPYLYSVDGGAGFTTSATTDSLPPGSYELVVQDANGCETREPLVIPIAPTLAVELGRSTVLRLGDSYRLDLRTNFADSSLASVSWSPALELDCTDCLRPVATPTASRVYRVEVASVDGCLAADSIRLSIDNLVEVYFPTAFSPDGDGVNDRFLPFGNPAAIRVITDFRVFDRWGGTVFSRQGLTPNDEAAGWDGRVAGELLNPAVFIYSATAEFVDGRVATYRGEVTLMR